MLRCFVQSVCDAILLKLHSGNEEGPDEQVLTAGSRGFTSDIPFSPLEAKATTRVAAAQTDFAKVDLSTWSPPAETEKEAWAREVLRQFAARWWAHNLAKEAMQWWNWNGRDP
jgi:hypothetical protein